MRPVVLKEIVDQDLNFEIPPIVDDNPLRTTLPVLHEGPKDPIKLLMDYGLEPRIFCVADPENTSPVFTVRSENWDWIVSPVRQDDLKTIPIELLHGLHILLENNFPIEAVALAKPLGKEIQSQVAYQEIYRELHQFVRAIGFIFLVAFRGMSKAANDFTKGVRNFSEVARELILDPVLIVKLGKNWIEIGRWE